MDLTETIARLSAEVSAQMADQFMNAWSPAQALMVNVQNAKTQRDVFNVMNALRTGIPEIDAADFVKHDAAQSVGVFTLRHRLKQEELIKRLGEQEQKLPISLDAAGSNKDSLTVRIK